jgi:predicted  nucleic acid-binding Zn-ribbon protein
LGKVENSFTDSRDVGQEYANLKSRLDAAMVVYNKMLEALQKRQVTIPEAVRLESELTPVLRRIEDLKNQIESLNNAVSFTTITVNFHEPSASANALKQAREDIRQSMLTAQINGVKLFAKIIQDLPSIILLVIWIAVILGAAILAKYWIVRIFKRG